MTDPISVIGPVAGIAGSFLNKEASDNAVDAQQQAAQNASATQMAMFNKTQENLAPYMDTGKFANETIKNNFNSLIQPIAPIRMDQATLEATPGYQFAKTQGLKAVQNSAAARGLGVSGAAMKGAANYATGLADNTYQNQFNNALTNKNLEVTSQNNIFNRLFGLTNLGENAAAGVGSAAINTGNSIAGNTIGSGNAAAAGAIRGGESWANGLNSIPQSYYTSKLLGGIYGNNGSSEDDSSYADGVMNGIMGGY